jgi:hypothetical protein
VKNIIRERRRQLLVVRKEKFVISLTIFSTLMALFLDVVGFSYTFLFSFLETFSNNDESGKEKQRSEM